MEALPEAFTNPEMPLSMKDILDLLLFRPGAGGRLRPIEVAEFNDLRDAVVEVDADYEDNGSFLLNRVYDYKVRRIEDGLEEGDINAEFDNYFIAARDQIAAARAQNAAGQAQNAAALAQNAADQAQNAAILAQNAADQTDSSENMGIQVGGRRGRKAYRKTRKSRKVNRKSKKSRSYTVPRS
jgi:hypothetical protein